MVLLAKRLLEQACNQDCLLFHSRYCIKNINDERVFIVLYAISAVYFAGVMVRLMLTLTPCVCILAAIAFSKLFELYLRVRLLVTRTDANA